jgi:TRAP-type C4-dicarboxylate transport system substrate-binding protein
VLFASIVCVFAGCGGKDAVAPIEVERQAFEALRSEIRAVIDDPAREAEAIALVDLLVDDLDNLREKISERRKRAWRLNAEYDTSRADFQAFFDQVDKEIQSNKRQVSERQRKLFAVTTPDERSAISKVHTKAMDAATRNIQTI